MRLALFCALTLTLLIGLTTYLACSPDAEVRVDLSGVEVGTILGQVRSADLESVAGARVTVQGPEGFEREATTDETGTFSLQAPVGACVIEAALEEELSRKARLEIRSSSVAWADLVLGPSQELALAVTDLEGHPVAGARVAIRDWASADAEVLETSPGGLASVGVVAKELRDVQIWAPGFRFVSQEHGPSDPTPLRITLTPIEPTQTTLVFRDREDQPIAGARVSLEVGLHLGQVASATTDSEGRASFENLPPGLYLFRLDGVSGALSYPGLLKISSTVGRFEQEPGASFELAVVVDPLAPREVGGQLYSLSGELLAGEVLSIVGEGDRFEVTTDEHGSFRFQPGEVGTYEVTLQKEGWVLAASSRALLPLMSSDPDEDGPVVTIPVSSFRVRPGEIVCGPGRQLQASPATSLAGVAVDLKGRPVAGARISVSVDSGRTGYWHYQTRTDEAGRFTFESLPSVPAGAYRVSARRGGWSAEIQSFEPVASKTTEVRLQMKQPRRLHGQVVDQDGRPLDGAFVVEGLSQASTTGPDGRFVIDQPLEMSSLRTTWSGIEHSELFDPEQWSSEPDGGLSELVLRLPAR